MVLPYPFILFSFYQVWFKYNEIHPFEVWISMNFNKCMLPCNRHLIQETEYFHHPQSSLGHLPCKPPSVQNLHKHRCAFCQYRFHLFVQSSLPIVPFFMYVFGFEFTHSREIFLRSIHVVACFDSSFVLSLIIFSQYEYTTIFYPFSCWEAFGVSRFCLFWRKILLTLKHMCLCENMFLLLLGEYIGVKFLSHTGCFLTFPKTLALNTFSISIWEKRNVLWLIVLCWKMRRTIIENMQKWIKYWIL